MLENTLGLLGVVFASAGCYFIYNKLLGGYVDSKQVKHEEKVKKIEQDVARLDQQNKDIDKQTEKEVKEIENEQNKNLTGDDLANWYNRRKDG